MARREELKELKNFLESRIIGQEYPIKLIADAILRVELGFNSSSKPKSSMLLLGPTGVGKTEIVLSLAEFLFKDLTRVKRFDMAEYQRQESLNWLLGDNKVSQGLLGDVIDELNKKGGGILLFDEIEKAHKTLTTIFLAALDAGKISMSNGEIKNLNQCYIFFTSNLGGSDAAQMTHSNYVTIRRHVERCAQNYFSPELFARFDEIVVFTKLTYDAQLNICKKMLESEINYISTLLGKELRINEDVFSFLIKKGYSKELGARIMRKTIKKEIGNALVNWKLNSDFNNKNDYIDIFIENFKLIAI